jgi:hypothetical protein
MHQLLDELKQKKIIPQKNADNQLSPIKKPGRPGSFQQ